MTTERSCAHDGHIWIEPDGQLYTRHRDRPARTMVDVHCQFCDATASLPAHGKATAPPRTGPARMT